jgi:hypothetical protein
LAQAELLTLTGQILALAGLTQTLRRSTKLQLVVVMAEPAPAPAQCLAPMAAQVAVVDLRQAPARVLGAQAQQIKEQTGRLALNMYQLTSFCAIFLAVVIALTTMQKAAVVVVLKLLETLTATVGMGLLPQLLVHQ